MALCFLRYVRLIQQILVVLTSTVIVARCDAVASILDGVSDFENKTAESQLMYGIDRSWPMQIPQKMLDTAVQYPLFYQYMKGCYDTYNVELCDENEALRVERNINQPKLVHRNYTSAGYAKVQAPIGAYTTLRDFWNKFSAKYSLTEVWDVANIYTNHWIAPTEVLMLDPNPNQLHPDGESAPLPHMSIQNRRKIIEQVQDVLERWTGVSLQPTSLYGIRSYTNGSILAPHVDRVPLVISAIINVAQDVDEDWVLELIGHDGYSMNLTMSPGDMVLYESHSIIHGRPYPLSGRFYANCFIHFEPIGYSDEYFNEQRRRKLVALETPRDKYEAAIAKLPVEKGLNMLSSGPLKEVRSKAKLPHYIQEGTLEAKRWRQEFDFVRVHMRNEKAEDIFPMVIQRKPKTLGATSAHILAASNDIDRIREVAKTDPKSLTKADVNGWKPIHEAARGGSTEVLKFLIEEYSVDVNERTNGGSGASPLWWAEKELPEGHEVVKLLRRHGAIAKAPFEEDKEESAES